MSTGMLRRITPVILTRNEEANLERTLGRLAWASEVVVVDSRSTDATVAIARRASNVRLVTRPFDSHASQWNFAIRETGIATDWVLALDADYVLPEALVDELDALDPPAGVAGYRTRFVYCVDGKPLRSTLYPPVTVLFRRSGAEYAQDGHTQRVRVNGAVVALRAPILHDDRKSLASWVAAQDRYARLEAAKLRRATSSPRWSERVRRMRVVAPPAMLLYCLIGRGLLLDGWPGIYYSLQRTFAELLLSLYLIRDDLTRSRARQDAP